MAATPIDPASCWIAPREPDALPGSGGGGAGGVGGKGGGMHPRSPTPSTRAGPASTSPLGGEPMKATTAMPARPATATARLAWMGARPPARAGRARGGEGARDVARRDRRDQQPGAERGVAQAVLGVEGQDQHDPGRGGEEGD